MVDQNGTSDGISICKTFSMLLDIVTRIQICFEPWPIPKKELDLSGLAIKDGDEKSKPPRGKLREGQAPFRTDCCLENPFLSSLARRVLFLKVRGLVCVCVCDSAHEAVSGCPTSSCCNGILIANPNISGLD